MNPKMSFLFTAFLLLMLSPLEAQIELKPLALELNGSFSQISFSNKQMTISNTSSDFLGQGNITYRTNGRHIFSDALLGPDDDLIITTAAEVQRTSTGAADLLPYAYGRIAANSANVVAGTGNYTVGRSGNTVDVLFSEPVVNNLVVTATAHQYWIGDLSFIPYDISVQFLSTTLIRFHLEDTDSPFSFVAYKQ